MLTVAPPGNIDLHQLNRDLDRTKTAVFVGSNAAFFGSVLCSMNFQWTHDLPTAGTDGTTLWWNPAYFLSLPPDSRKTDLLHEIRHAAYLHQIRRGDRNPKVWNIACDIKIDLELENEGHSFTGIKGVLTMGWLNAQQYHGQAEEQIYDALLAKHAKQIEQLTGAPEDILDLSNQQKQALVNMVVQAVQAAKMIGQAGSVPGSIQETIKEFLEPVIPWQTVLMQWFTDLGEEDYSFLLCDRRYLHADIHLPSLIEEEGRLRHITCYEDTSGSVSTDDSLRVNSEIKYIQTVLRPQRLTKVQFDTRIRDVRDFTEDEPFEEIVIKGRGGTDLRPVRDHIIETRPSAALIFSDLDVEPMDALPFDIPVIWVCVGNPGATVPFGKLIHIK